MNKVRLRLSLISLFLVIFSGSITAFAQTSAFTYQGRLTDNNAAANGTYEMQFSLFDAAAGNTQIGATVTNNSVTVVNGIFTVTLDFGASTFTSGAERWLEIGVRKASDPPGFTILAPRQQVSSSPYAVKTISAASADSLSPACVGCVTDAKIAGISGSKVTGTVTNATNAANALNVTGLVGISNGGTGAVTASGARFNLGISGGNNYVSKFTNLGLSNSLIQDNGTSLGFNFSPQAPYLAYFYRQQSTTDGDGQHVVYGQRNRFSQNDGTGYGFITSNSGVAGQNFWGDLYTFGVGGWNYNDFTRTGGVVGAEIMGGYWGSLGYKNSGSVSYGVYGSSAYSSGGGLTAEKQGIGGGFFGGMIGSWSRGEVMGQINSGELFAAYNLGNVYTSGFTADMVSVGSGANASRVAAFAVTSPGLKVYDDGTAQLDGESVFVPFNSDYAGMLAETPNVTVTAIGSPAQLYIKSIEKNGFTVAAAAGKTSVKFSWIAVGSRVDANKAALLPNQITEGNFDSQLKEVLVNDGDTKETGKPIWWDGSKFRFDKAPEIAKPERVVPKTNN